MTKKDIEYLKYRLNELNRMRKEHLSKKISKAQLDDEFITVFEIFALSYLVEKEKEIKK